MIFLVYPSSTIIINLLSEISGYISLNGSYSNRFPNVSADIIMGFSILNVILTTAGIFFLGLGSAKLGQDKLPDAKLEVFGESI